MKKILALVLAIIMMAAIAVPAFAAATTQELKDSNAVDSEDVKVTYGVAQAYVVTIPADVAFAEDSNGAITDVVGNLAVTNLKIAGNEKLVIRVDSYYDFKLVDTNQKSSNVIYTVTPAGGNALEDNGIALTVNRKAYDANEQASTTTTGAAGSTNLTFSTKGTAQEGAYEDYLTFKVTIEADPQLLPTDIATLRPAS